MLAVLMSMKPEWWEKILDGEKTLEIRKTHPQNERLEWPVTVLGTTLPRCENEQKDNGRNPGP